MKSTKISNIILDILKFAILILGAAITVMPFIWMILSSLKTASEITAIPPTFSLRNFVGRIIRKPGAELLSLDISLILS